MKQEKMKYRFLTFLALISLVVLSGTIRAEKISPSNSFVDIVMNFCLEEEEYINDIPFDTEDVVLNGNPDLSPDFMRGQVFILEEEAYIDDIPFDTHEIASVYMNGTKSIENINLAFTLDEELYIDDIPFNTEMVVAELKHKTELEKALEETFAMDEEGYIDDIPFNTLIVFNNHMKDLKDKMTFVKK